MKSIIPLQNKYLKKPKDYMPRNISWKRTPRFIQTADNCWIYYILNNLYFNTGIIVDGEKFEQFVASYGRNPKKANTGITSWVLLCEYVRLTQNIDLQLVQVSVMWNIKLFTKMLGAWYAIGYSRDCWIKFFEDVRADNELDFALKRSTAAQHFTNIYFYNKKLNELGTRGNNIYNEFTFHDTNIFIQSVRDGWIRDKVLFIDYA